LHNFKKINADDERAITMPQEATSTGLVEETEPKTSEKVEEQKTQDTSVPEGEATTPKKTDGAETSKEEVTKASDTLQTEPDLKDFLPDTEHNQGMQKRIDKLTAKNKMLMEKLEEQSIQQNEKSKEGKPKYTVEQLKGALRQARENGDIDLEMEVLSYMNESTKEELRNEYVSEKTNAQKQQELAVQEWKEVLNQYGYLASDTQPEMYPGARKDLNIQDPKSLLQSLAKELYKDPKYNFYGGQRLAVADALGIILRKKTNSQDSAESMRLKRQLEKEKMKTAPVSGDSEGGGGDISQPTGLMPADDKLAQYVEERRNQKEKADRGPGA